MQDELVVTLNEADIAEAYRPTPPRYRAIRYLRFLLIAAAVLLVVVLLRDPEGPRLVMHSPLTSGLAGVAIGLAALVTILLAAGRALRPVAARKTLANNPGMADPVRYAFDPDHFEVRTTYTQARYPWSQLWDWHETDRVIIVKPGPANFFVIPKRDAEPAALDRLRGYLAAARRRAR